MVQQIPLQNGREADRKPNGQQNEPNPIPASRALPDRRKTSLTFLLNLTDPKNTTISEAFHSTLRAPTNEDKAVQLPESALPSINETDTFVPVETATLRAPPSQDEAELPSPNDIDTLIPSETGTWGAPPSQDEALQLPEAEFPSLDEVDTFVSVENAVLNALFGRETLADHHIDQTARTSEYWLDTWDETESPMPGMPWPDVHPCDKLFDSLTQFTRSLRADHPEKAPNAKLAKSSGLFSAGSIERLKDQYFQGWGQHTPVVHQGTFCIYDTVPHLLLAIVLIGATFSTSADEVSLANNMFDLADEYVFSNPIIQKTIAGYGPDEMPNDKEAFQSLKAVFLMSQIQLRTAAVIKRKEVRTNRFDQIILACRALGLLEYKNSFWRHHKDAFHWQNYVDSDSRIRLMCGIFNLDAIFTVLYNSPPRLLAEEMEVDMPGPLDAFMATSPGESCQAASQGHENAHLTLARLCDIFMRDDLEEETSATLKKLSVVDLFNIVLALLQLLWLSPYKSTKANTIDRVSQALSRWKTAWDHQNSILTAQELEKYGLPRIMALEFWQLATFMIKKGKPRLDATMMSSYSPVLREGMSVYDILKSIDKEGFVDP